MARHRVEAQRNNLKSQQVKAQFDTLRWSLRWRFLLGGFYWHICAPRKTGFRAVRHPQCQASTAQQQSEFSQDRSSALLYWGFPIARKR